MDHKRHDHKFSANTLITFMVRNIRLLWLVSSLMMMEMILLLSAVSSVVNGPLELICEFCDDGECVAIIDSYVGDALFVRDDMVGNGM